MRETIEVEGPAGLVLIPADQIDAYVGAGYRVLGKGRTEGDPERTFTVTSDAAAFSESDLSADLD